MASTRSVEERFAAKWTPEPNTGCWLWTAYVLPNGYGRFSLDGSTQYAHRVAYERWVGPIPDGLEIDHLCRQRSCVNPAHMEPVTHRVNTLRGETNAAKNLAKTHCKHGHPFDEANTYRNPNGSRKCRVCGMAADKRYRLRKQANTIKHNGQ